MVTTNNPNVYGAIDVTVPPIKHWTDNAGLNYPWYAYHASNVVYNDLDGQIYTAATWHIPGSYYLTDGTQMIHEDNRPLPGEPWKQYWTRATMPAAWSSTTDYSLGNIVSYATSIGNGNYLYFCYQCISGNNTGQAPASFGQSNSYWQSLQWQYSTAYTANTSYVSCDNAYYQMHPEPHLRRLRLHHAAHLRAYSPAPVGCPGRQCLAVGALYRKRQHESPILPF